MIKPQLKWFLRFLAITCDFLNYSILIATRFLIFFLNDIDILPSPLNLRVRQQNSKLPETIKVFNCLFVFLIKLFLLYFSYNQRLFFSLFESLHKNFVVLIHLLLSFIGYKFLDSLSVRDRNVMDSPHELIKVILCPGMEAFVSLIQVNDFKLFWNLFKIVLHRQQLRV